MVIHVYNMCNFRLVACISLKMFLRDSPLCNLYPSLQGGWVLLQNCHLGLDFMDELLETILEHADTAHHSCRVWITTEVHDKFPISLLQVCSSPAPNTQ